MRTFSLRSAQVDIDSLDLEETLTTFEKVPRVEDLFNEADGDGLNLRYCLAEIRFEQSLNLDENLPGWSASFTEKSKKDRPAGFRDTNPPPPSSPPPVREHCESELLEWKRRSDQIKQILKSENERSFGQRLKQLKAKPPGQHKNNGRRLTPAVKKSLHELLKIFAKLLKEREREREREMERERERMFLDFPESSIITIRIDEMLDELDFEFGNNCLSFLISISDDETATTLYGGVSPLKNQLLFAEACLEQSLVVAVSLRPPPPGPPPPGRPGRKGQDQKQKRQELPFDVEYAACFFIYVLPLEKYIYGSQRLERKLERKRLTTQMLDKLTRHGFERIPVDRNLEEFYKLLPLNYPGLRDAAEQQEVPCIQSDILEISKISDISCIFL